jgi:methylase of polypeptide subunit release factors
LSRQNEVNGQLQKMHLSPEETALAIVGKSLQQRGYKFVTVSPETHTQIIQRATGNDACREAFGWSRWLDKTSLPPDIFEPLQDAGLVEIDGEQFRSLIRYSSLDGQLFAHSAFPTDSKDAVFFGPDTYRFIHVLRRRLPECGLSRMSTIVDVGCGSGAGGIFAAKLLGPRFRSEIILADVSEKALSFSRANISINAVNRVETLHSDVLGSISGDIDLIIANPPYLIDAQNRLYRDGGGEFGLELSLRIVREALEHLKTDGTLVLYTGTPVVGGHDLLREALVPTIEATGLAFEYEELDPDVFGEELAHPPYDQADRIAVVALILRKY